MFFSSEPVAGNAQSLKMNDTQGNGTKSSLPFISSEVNAYLAIVTAINSINIILGLPINSYVVWLILSGDGGTMASEFFSLNLTVSLIIYSLASVFRIAALFTHNNIFTVMTFFTFICFYHFSVPLFQCCICVERYIAVVHPVVFLRYKALRYRVACCCVVWLMVFALSLFYLLSDKVVCYVSLGFCIVCISVVSFCCLSVLRALKQPGPGEGQRDNGNDMKRRAFRIILVSLVVMVVTIMSFLPYILSLSQLVKHSNPDVTLITYLFGRLSGFFHPLLYVLKAGKLPCFKLF